MASKAPTLNKMANSPQRLAPGQPPARPPGPGQPATDAPPASAERERVVAAVEFGAALEDLVAYARLRQEESDAVPQTSGPRFPPDLLLRRDPEDLLRSTCRKLLKLEPTLLRPGPPDGTAAPQRPPNLHGPPTSNGRPASAIPPNSDEPSASNGAPTSQGVSAPDRRSDSTGHPASAGLPTDQPEEKTSQAGSRNQGEPPTSNGHQPQEGPRTDQSLLGLEPALPGLDQRDGTMPQDEPRSPEGRPPQEKSRTDKPGRKTPQDGSRNRGGRQTPNGHHPQKGLHPPPGSPAQPGPSTEWKIEERVGALLGASVRGARESRGLGQRLSDLGELDRAICKWDEDVVEHIIDSPAVLGGYRVGKALSLTRWKIRVAKHWKQADADPSVDPWEDAFCKERVDEIQRHVNSLSTVLDAQAVTAVSTSLGYWRNALLSLTTGEGSSGARPRSWWRSALMRLASIGESSKSAQPPSPQTIQVAPEHGEKLLKALEEQIDHWLDLLTEQRSPESFPVAGIVATLTKKMAADLWSRLFRLLIPVVAAVAVLVIVGGLGVAGYMVLSTASTDAGSGGPKGLLGSLGTAVGGVITFLAVQGRSLLGRGTGAGNDAWGRNGNGGMRNSGVFPRSNYGVAAAAGVVADLQREVLSGVVDQLKVEELNLAVSEPLMRCVLALNNRESKKGDPLKDAERFLRLIHRDKSNLDRLRPVFKDLYKH